MLSKKQQRRLIRSTYGTAAQFIEAVKRMYRNADRQIKGEISAFLMSEANWSAPAQKADVEDAVAELKQFDSSVAPLAAFYTSSLLLGHPKQSDLVAARIAIPMIKVGQSMNQMLKHSGDKIQRDVGKISKEQAVQTPGLHQIPYNYDAEIDAKIKELVSEGISQRQGGSGDINRLIRQSIDRIKIICQRASQDTDAKHDYAKDVERVITGKNGKGGASARSEMIMRTQTCRELNKATIADFWARGVKKYRFLSLEAVNSCKDCTSIDDNVYDVSHAQEGVNLPPMHPNCQCWISEVEDTTDDYGSGSDLPITEDSWLTRIDFYRGSR